MDWTRGGSEAPPKKLEREAVDVAVDGVLVVGRDWGVGVSEAQQHCTSTAQAQVQCKLGAS